MAIAHHRMKNKDIVLAIFIMFLWGFNFVVIKIGLDSFPPLFFSALRFLTAALPAVLLFDRGGVQWKWIISIGVLLGILVYGFLFVGMYMGMPAGLSSIVLQSQVIFTILFSMLLLKDAPSKWQIGGLVLAISGIVLLAIDKFETTSFWGLVLIIGAGLAWGLSNIMMKRAGNIDMFRLIIWMSLIPPLPLFLVSMVFESNQWQALTNITWTGASVLLYTGLISTVFAFAVWGKLFREYSPIIVAPFSLLAPIFGILSGVLVLNESLGTVELLASCLVLLGLVAIVFGPKLLMLFTKPHPTSLPSVNPEN